MKCGACDDTGIEHSGVCHCGASMDGHSFYDNHSATEMTRPCESCSRPPLTPYGEALETVKELKGEVARLEAALRKVQQMSEVPAAEYVPALCDIWEGCSKALFGGAV